MDGIIKEKYLNFFKYLLDVSTTKNEPIRDIKNVSSLDYIAYWLNEIPGNRLLKCLFHPNASENKYGLKLEKPKEPIVPKFPDLPDNLKIWVDKDSLINNRPLLSDSIVVNDKEILLKNHSEVLEEFECYIEFSYYDDLFEYNAYLTPYEEEYKKYDEINEIYNFFLNIYNKINKRGNDYELVIGLGLLDVNKSLTHSRIFRHIITLKTSIELEVSGDSPTILLSLNFEHDTKIETDFFLDLNIFDVNNVVKAEKSLENFFNENNINSILKKIDSKGIDLNALKFKIEEIIREFANNLGADYADEVVKPNIHSEKQNISFSPALILRKKDKGSSILLYKHLIKNIEYIVEDNIDSLNDLLEINEDDERKYVENERGKIFQNNYYLEGYNKEQISLLEHAKYSNKALVQVRNSQGEYHSVASIICHLLVISKKILISAYISEVLEVFREKLPPEFQNITVNILDDNSLLMTNLTNSINIKADKNAKKDLEECKHLIEGTYKRLDKIRESITFKINNFLALKEKGSQEIKLNKYFHGTLINISRKIAEDFNNNKWYIDDYYDINDSNVIDSLKEFISLYNDYKDIDMEELKKDVPSLDKLPNPNSFEEYCTLIQDSLNNLSANVRLEELKKGSKIEEKFMSFEKYDELFGSLNKVKGLFITIDQMFKDLRIGNDITKIESNINKTEIIISQIAKYNFMQINKITYPKDKKIKDLISDLDVLIDYLKDGEDFSDLLFPLKKLLIPKEIKKRLYLIKDIKIDDYNSNTLTDFEIVKTFLILKQYLSDLFDIWGYSCSSKNTLLNQVRFYKNISRKAKSLVKSISEVKDITKEIDDDFSLKINLFDINELDKIIKKLEKNRILNFDKKIIESIDYLKNKKFNSISSNIISDFKEFNTSAYRDNYNKIKDLASKHKDYIDFINLKLELNKKLPNIIDSIEENVFTYENLEDLKFAFYYLDAKKQIEALVFKDKECELIKELNRFKDFIKEKISIGVYNIL